MIYDNIPFTEKKSIYYEYYYSLKGILKNISFKKEDGDKFWEEFLSSKILDDIVQILYKKENIFNQKTIKDLFKERSYYYPNFNQSFISLSHKELFNMYFPPSKVEYHDIKYKDSFIFKMIDKAVHKLEIQHEWGHTNSAFLYFTLKIKYNNTPERKIKFQNNSNSYINEKINKESGQSLEILMYGRIIEYLNTKEAIFILNSNNYKLSLNEFRSKFISLENKKLEEIFKEEMDNPYVDKYVIKSYEEYQQKGEVFQQSLENYSFKIKGNQKKYINLDNAKFKIGKNKHHQISSFHKK